MNRIHPPAVLRLRGAVEYEGVVRIAESFYG